MTTKAKSIEEMSTAELEEQLQKKKERERKELERKKKQYEEATNERTKNLVGKAIELKSALEAFKEICVQELDQQRELIQEYGSLRSNSKGGFSIENADGTARIKHPYRSIGVWDERATKAVELLKGFLHDTVKKRDKDAYEIIISLLEKNKDGQFEYSRIQTLYKYEDRFDDKRWKEAIRLLKESYKITSSKYDIYFQIRNGQGKWQTLNLNFASL